MKRKHFLTYEKQIEKLQNEKKLLISNPEFAIAMLKKIGYFSLIDGYKDLFKHKPSGKYLHGVTFEEITELYYFDEKLRTLFLQQILHIERHIKSLFSYYFCEKYGENQTTYLTENNYNKTKKNSGEIIRLVQTLSKSISLPNNYSYITHYTTVYNNVPLWVAINTFTFGQVSKMYQYATSDVRTKICLHFHNLSEVQLHQFIRILASCRNICAHNERLYSFHVNESIPNMPIHQALNLKLKNGHYIVGKHDLFAVVIAIYYLTDANEFNEFKTHLENLINSVLNNCPHISQELLYTQMGFPVNWKDIAL